MSLENFKPTLWASRLLKQLDENYVLVSLCNRDYEGDISGAGDTVKINSIGDISVSDYTSTSTISFQQLDDAQTKLEIDQQKYFAFEIDDIDVAQANVNVMDRAMEKAGIALEEKADDFIAGKHGEAGTDVVYTSTTTSFHEDTVNKAMQKLRQTLDENNVPKQGRWVVLPPWAVTKLNLAEIADLTSNNDVVANNYAGKVAGFEVYESNNLSTMSSTSNQAHALAGRMDAISFAEQIVNMEGLRRESSFRDAVKGLHVYGGKVVKPEQLIDFVIEEGTS